VLWVHREEEEKEFFTRIITEGEEGGSQPPADLAALGGAHPRYIRSRTRTEPATARAEAMGEVSEASRAGDASVSLPRSPPASSPPTQGGVLMAFVVPLLRSQEAKKEEAEKPKEAAAPAEDKPKDAPPAEEKPKEGGGEEKKEEAPPPPPPPPEEVEMRVYMHCEGCARKVKKILRRFDGNAAMSGRPAGHFSVSLTSLLCWAIEWIFSFCFGLC